MLYIITLGGIIILLILWIISVRRSFLVLGENINNAMSQIGIQLSSRWDMLTSLLELTKAYSEHEYWKLAETMKTRRAIVKESSPEDINLQENAITEVIGKIAAVAENYPELKADTTYIRTVAAVNQYENMLRTSRLIYNDCVTKLNRSIRGFPISLIAGLLGFSKRFYLEEQAENAVMPSKINKF